MRFIFKKIYKKKRVLQKRKTLQKRYDRFNESFSFFAYLNEKKRVIQTYRGGLKKKWLVRHCRHSEKGSTPTQSLTNLLLGIEQRLDVSLFRIRFCRSVSQAHQWIIHGKILVNQAPVTVSDFLLKPGDVISMKNITNNPIELKESFSISRSPTWKKMQSLDPGVLKRKKQRFIQRIASKSLKSYKNRKRAFQIKKRRPSFFFRPLHFEVNYSLKTAVLLYSPQKLTFSDMIRLDYLRRGLAN